MVPWRPPRGRECHTHGGVRVVCLCALRALRALCAWGAHRHCMRPRGTRHAMRMLLGDLGAQRHMWQNSFGASPDDVSSQSDPGQVYVPNAPPTRQRSHLSVYRCAARVRTIDARARVASAHARVRAAAHSAWSWRPRSAWPRFLAWAAGGRCSSAPRAVWRVCRQPDALDVARSALAARTRRASAHIRSGKRADTARDRCAGHSTAQTAQRFQPSTLV